MTKKFYVSATETRYLSAVVEVPDDWTVATLQSWYQDTGASGEFKEDSAEWQFEWDWCEEADDSVPANMIIEPRSEEQVS
jgi:hypothetical protein